MGVKPRPNKFKVIVHEERGAGHFERGTIELEIAGVSFTSFLCYTIAEAHREADKIKAALKGSK